MQLVADPFLRTVEGWALDSPRIVDADSDEEVLRRLSQAIDRRVPASLQGDLDRLVEAIQQLPSGLRAMASTYQLDVSLALDDLGWHFANWHHHGYALETSRGLRELGAEPLAATFDAAYALAVQYWPQLGARGFNDWYHGSELERGLEPLNEEMWAFCRQQGSLGLLASWVAYARRHPA